MALLTHCMSLLFYQGTQRRLPSALIIGVRKCGTRALLEMLNLHPDIRKRDAEAHFFDDEDHYIKGLDWYRKKMPYSFDNQVCQTSLLRTFVAAEAEVSPFVWICGVSAPTSVSNNIDEHEYLIASH